MPHQIEIAGIKVAPGERKQIKLPLSRLYDATALSIPITVINGAKKGPVLFVSSAIHGDEINGIEIVRRILDHKSLSRLKGTLIAVPILNVFGFNNRSRYLPDRRDLNRSFPGNPKGSLASRIAHTLMKEILEKCTHGLDLHTAPVNRINLPQVRGDLANPDVREMALNFGSPVILHAAARDGSLREAARHLGIPILLYEGGEGLRFDESAIEAGFEGAISLMRHIGMLPHLKQNKKNVQARFARSTYWVRAADSGILRLEVKLGDLVEKGAIIGLITDPLGQNVRPIKAKVSGMVIGKTEIPLVTTGDAIIHLAGIVDGEALLAVLENQFEEADLLN
jgi:predicted deacylase